MALESMLVCAAWPEPLVLTSVISTKFLCDQPIKLGGKIQKVRKIT